MGSCLGGAGTWGTGEHVLKDMLHPFSAVVCAQNEGFFSLCFSQSLNSYFFFFFFLFNLLLGKEEAITWSLCLNSRAKFYPWSLDFCSGFLFVGSLQQ